MALSNYVSYAAKINTTDNAATPKTQTQTLSGLNLAMSTPQSGAAETDHDLATLGQYMSSFANRMNAFSSDTVTLSAVVKEVAWQA